MTYPSAKVVISCGTASNDLTKFSKVSEKTASNDLPRLCYFASRLSKMNGRTHSTRSNL